MDKKKIPKESGELSRRDFLKDAGLVVGGAAIGSTVLLAACAPEVVTETVTETVSKFVCPSCGGDFNTLAALTDHFEATHPREVAEVPKAKRFLNICPERCVGCEVCVLSCSSYHEGIASRSLSRIRNDLDPLAPEFYHPTVCLQCDSPECYFSCPLEAIVIDAETGVRYINEDKCNGCGFCVDACPFDPPRITLDKERMIVLKCDLCRGRENGPACAEYCMTGTLLLAGEGIEEVEIYGEEAPGIEDLV